MIHKVVLSIDYSNPIRDKKKITLYRWTIIVPSNICLFFFFFLDSIEGYHFPVTGETNDTGGRHNDDLRAKEAVKRRHDSPSTS